MLNDLKVLGTHPLERKDQHRPSQAQWKRKVSSACTLSALLSYPSPPMSSPPSPPNPASNIPRATSHRPASQFTSSADSSTPFSTEASHSTAAVSAQPSSHGQTASDAPPSHYFNPPFAPQTLVTSPLPSFEFASQPAPATGVAQLRLPPLPAETTSAGRSGRKLKAHVASACVNCKRAHLSCDIQRPCTRCISSGKQVCDSSNSAAA